MIIKNLIPKNLETIKVLKKAIQANRILAKIISNQDIPINTLVSQEVREEYKNE